uniref:Uncharacterized protein n=1 Tax=viral metagenome TaxID=1070528 RepID=A0A6M3M1J8_9ZZZZ
MTRELPSAVTAEQLYMAAILEELTAIRKALAPAMESATTAEVALREPVKRQRGRPKKKASAGA